jgi:hypothetical protein
VIYAAWKIDNAMRLWREAHPIWRVMPAAKLRVYVLHAMWVGAEEYERQRRALAGEIAMNVIRRQAQEKHGLR